MKNILLLIGLSVFILCFNSCQHRTFCILFKDYSIQAADRISSKILSQNDSVKAERLSIDLKFEFVRNKCIEGRHTDLENDIYYQREDTLLNIKIVSNNDFDALHKAGTALNDLFLMPDTSWYKKFNNADENISDLTLALFQTTDTSRIHSIDVILEWNHNVTIIKTLPAIKLLK